MPNRKTFLQQLALGGAGVFISPSLQALFCTGNDDDYTVPPELQQEMYAAALRIAKSKVRGGPADPAYKKPYADAAFSNNIFLWDTCFIAAYAKYHQQELPIANALDNFYNLQEADGFISREYTKEGKTMWPKEHPVSINPPLLAFAELELHSRQPNRSRLKKVYPHLHHFYKFLLQHYRMDDHLFFNDAFGSGMDNIERFPPGWKDDGKGIQLVNLYPEIFDYNGLSPAWNRQGRSVDITAQMALFATNLSTIARITGHKKHIAAYTTFYNKTKEAVNRLCWNEEDSFYYDLGYGTQIRRKHIGMFWVLLAGLVPDDRLERFLSHLTNPNEFWRKFPVASFPANQPQYNPAGGYWLGSNWAPTTYMVIRGLQHCGKPELAAKLAKQYYWCVAQVYKATGTFWENYAPDFLKQGSDSRKDFCGWTAIAPIAIWHEFIKA